MALTVLKVAEALFSDSKLWGRPDLPFEAHLEPGHARVLIVAGENCSGKSFLVGNLLGWGKKFHGISPVEVSIRQRVGGGTAEMGSFARMMMFGDETEHSTGATSTKVLEGAFGTIASRAAEKQSALLVLDEPELGLSEGYSHAMGTHLAQKFNLLPKLAAGLIIVTHSRVLVKAFEQELGEAPSFCKLGDEGTYLDWLKGEPQRSVKELLELPARSRQGWQAINEISRKLKASSPK